MKQSKANQLAIKMAIALVVGLACGTGFIFLRETLLSNGNGVTWKLINNLLFQDISAEGASNAVGLFYILGQCFINSLQLIIIPMVFTSITLAICNMEDAKKLGRISYKTIKWFLISSFFALLLAGAVGFTVYHLGGFNVGDMSNLNAATGTTGANPLLIFVQAIPNNILATFTNNGKILSIVVLAVIFGLSILTLGDKITIFKKFCQEVNDIVVTFLSYVINTFGPWAIFILITRTFAIYGIEHLKPALTYVVTTVICLLLFLWLAYGLIVQLATGLKATKFVSKISKVSLFGFSTSSSAATLPLNTKTTVEELGVSDEIASFVLPLGMTVNMNGTAIMQVIASIFIAASAGYPVTIGNITIIAILALIASVGTPAAPGAGAVILFTILTGMGYTNDAALLAYSLILAINRPIEMLVTSLNVVGDSATAVIVAKSEGMLDEDIYNG